MLSVGKKNASDTEDEKAQHCILVAGCIKCELFHLSWINAYELGIPVTFTFVTAVKMKMHIV